MFDQNPENNTTIDELIKIVMIDKVRKVKLTIQLRDPDGDEVPIQETIEKLTEYVDDKIKDKEVNSCRQQILPLMAQSMVGGLSKLIGPDFASMMLSQDHIRYSLVHMMTVGFYLLKFIQNKKIKVHTIEEPLTEDDIATYERVSQASNLAVTATAMGADPKEVVKEMLEKGLIKHADLEMMGAEWATKNDNDEGEGSGGGN